MVLGVVPGCSVLRVARLAIRSGVQQRRNEARGIQFNPPNNRQLQRPVAAKVPGVRIRARSHECTDYRRVLPVLRRKVMAVRTLLPRADTSARASTGTLISLGFGDARQDTAAFRPARPAR